MPQHQFRLIPFTKDRQSSTGQIEVAGSILREGEMLTLDYDVNDAFYEIHWPNPVSKPMRKDDLWKQTCFEVFIAPWGVKGYWEFNFAPNGDWNCYQFNDYREGQKPEFSIQDIDSSALESQGTHKRFRVSIPLFKEVLNTTWSVGICAVLLDKNRQTHYYALTHCTKEPDFHQRNSFMLTLTPR